ncbi:Aspartyl protease [Handroanthus impetiginosus]|uniref:Aspartyl protease n=1 Tax=Handroanthus impetiginosus TaxID=429701 RepID=A0A2G9G0Y5_9LAMI|nr:Aspartyl protease [Handroanthus impetiginosus]
MAISLFFTVLSLSFLQSIASNSTGFTLKLVHRESPSSPLYEPNLSHFQRFMKNIKISKARASYFQQLSETIGVRNSAPSQNASLWLPLKPTEPIYTVELGLGTPVVKRTLIFDTGSALTWTQCRPCLRCFKQREPLFDIRQSSSYRLMSRRNKLAGDFNCNLFGCVYYVQYYSGQFSAGLVSVETFTFRTSTGVPCRVPDLVFGCGTMNQGRYGFTNIVNGILGMDKRAFSFARQLGGLIKYRFSYCLPAIYSNNSKESYLRFGEAAILRGGNVQRTPFLTARQNAIFYGLNLTDISIGGLKLGLRETTFPDGCIIDSGFKNFPDMTFHFQGADFHVPFVNVFMFDERRFFCLAMIASANMTLLGAYQQQNVRIAYDLKDQMLSFAPDDCSNDSAREVLTDLCHVNLLKISVKLKAIL